MCLQLCGGLLMLTDVDTAEGVICLNIRSRYLSPWQATEGHFHFLLAKFVKF